MEQESCSVCGQPLLSDDVASCGLCGGRFHLAWSVQSKVQNCGIYRFDERSYALVFICARCVAHPPPPGE